MCIECKGTIILRTLDRTEKEVQVGNCDIWEYRVPILKMSASVWNSSPDFPATTETRYRMYKWEGERRGPVRILVETEDLALPTKIVQDPVEQLDLMFNTSYGRGE